ncbi:MAG TPA: hypothetical protein VMK30_05665 [Pleomorphomonadaceae bacterium]|nr:hypothetical protein [Pleomorphomonadaceae bacterium]
MRPLRVAQWATGNVGQAAIRAVLDRPDMELAGVLVHDPAKAGRDAGEVLGIGPLGVLTTADIRAIEDLDADCVCYAPLPSAMYGDDPGADLRNILRLLESGKNVVTTVGYVYPKAYGEAVAGSLERACQRGGVSFHGTGLNPGWQGDLVPLVMSGLAQRVDHIHVLESSDMSFYPSPEVIFDMMGMGKSPSEFEAGSGRYADWLTDLFSESIHMIADGLGVQLERIARSFDVLVAERPFDVAAGRIEAGGVAAQRWRWAGMAQGREVIVHETHWRMHPDLARDWSEPGGLIRIEGTPRVRMKLEHDWITEPLAATAMHAISAIPSVCGAPPGVRTFLDLPLIAGRPDFGLAVTQ